MQKYKIAVFGGTFNPPHIGHVRSAEVFYQAITPDKFIVIPTNIPPHKSFEYEVTGEDRLNMCRLAFSHIPNLEVSSIEIERGGKSYTYLTLNELSAEDRELYFLVGTDMFITIDTWMNFERIFELATICLIRRENSDDDFIKIKEKLSYYHKQYGARIIEIDASPIEISSSEIRNELAKGNDVNGSISASVMDYISNKGLYT